MLIIDESISEFEIWQLRRWGFRLRAIGPDLGNKSISDEDILPLLLRLKRPTFFTRDRDFWQQALCHHGYCLVYVDVLEEEGEIAAHVRRFLRHRDFKVSAQRLGKVVHLYQRGIAFYQCSDAKPHRLKW
jgi:hypothetical protein